MARRHTVERLPDDQLQFVIDLIIDGETDREISLHFEDKFTAKLPKSSLARWRKTAGDQLAENFRLARYTAKQFIEDAKLDPDVDKYQVFLESVEDRLLTATREVHQQDPFKLVLIQQEEKRRNLKERELALKERALDLDRERLHGVALDRVKLGEEYAADLLEYIGEDPEGLRWFQRHAQLFQTFISKKYAATSQS